MNAEHRRGHGRLRAELRQQAQGSRPRCRPPILNLLVNGASGIAVGMGHEWRPRTTSGEVVAAAKHLMAHPDATLDELMYRVPGPDWPGGGTHRATTASGEAYATGRGALTTRSATHVENRHRPQEADRGDRAAVHGGSRTRAGAHLRGCQEP
ncbi:MAG: DNA gyrase subunit A [Bifidobacterium pullorum]